MKPNLYCNPHFNLEVWALNGPSNCFLQVTPGHVRLSSRMDTSALWGKWRGLLVGTTLPLPALMPPPASGKRRTTILRSDTIHELPLGCTCGFKIHQIICYIFPELDRVGGTWKWGEMCDVGALRQPVGNMQQRQERLDLGRSVRRTGLFSLAPSRKV